MKPLGLVVFLAALAGCCPSPTGDVLVVNNTRETVVFAFADASQSTKLTQGRLGMLSGEPGAQTIVAKSGDREVGRTALNTKLESVAIALADPSQCVAVVDYTRQFSDESGPIDVLALVASEPPSGSAKKHPTTLTHGQLSQIFGPYDEVPTETYPNAIVRRATPVGCELLDDEEVLVNTLARLP